MSMKILSIQYRKSHAQYDSALLNFPLFSFSLINNNKILFPTQSANSN